MAQSLPIVFHTRLFILLFCGFVVATTVGVLSHESGHYFMAKYLGFTGLKMRYNSTSWRPSEGTERRATHREGLMMIAAGPVQTVMTGTIGVALLFIFRKNYRREQLLTWQWLIVFLALFWLREISDLVREFYLVHFTRNHALSGDEFLLSKDMGFSPWFLNVVLGGIALIVLGLIIYRFVPALQRFTFLTAGLLGGITGAVLWLGILGPQLMP